MSAIDTIREKLTNYPELSYSVTDNTIRIDPPSVDGFSVWLTEGATAWTVGFDGWHGDFDREEDALDCFAMGLSDACRLEITLRGDVPYKWTLRCKTEDGWEYHSTIGTFLFPFWRRKRIEYRHNDVMKGI